MTSAAGSEFGSETDDGAIGALARDVVRATGPLRLAAAERLVSVPRSQRKRAARGLIRQAPTVGIDLNLIWAYPNPSRTPHEIAQACLVVPGAGRTAMVFISPPDEDPEPPIERQRRAATLRTALHDLRDHPGIRLAQALPEPSETWSMEACLAAGMTPVGTLSYLRADLTRTAGERAPGMDDPGWPEGVGCRSLADVPSGLRETTLAEVLERSYEGTLDCPELCGLRSPEDVIESHQATGIYDPARWWFIESDGAPEGCVLMTHCPEQSSVELVYLGLSPQLRGRGVARIALERAIESCRDTGASSVTCAVDRRNAPARRLYDTLGFTEFTSRKAYVSVV